MNSVRSTAFVIGVAFAVDVMGAAAAPSLPMPCRDSLLRPASAAHNFAARTAALPAMPRHAQILAKNATGSWNPRVMLVSYDPVLRDGRRLSVRLGWGSPAALSEQIAQELSAASRNRLRYRIVASQVITDTWLPKEADGFRYDEDSYLAVYGGQMPPHPNDIANYMAIFGDPRLDLCGRVNRNEIDEIWMWGGPWFGFYESRLAGPGAYWFNAPPLTTTSCNRIVPIMGFNMALPAVYGLHSFGHRIEFTMQQVYGRWEVGQLGNPWERFAPKLYFTPSEPLRPGCGSVHFPPNANMQTEYRYDLTLTVNSWCNDFAAFPAFFPPAPSASVPVNCTAWGCDETGFQRWWLRRLPAASGFDSFGRAADWWIYIANPALANTPTSVGPQPLFAHSFEAWPSP